MGIEIVDSVSYREEVMHDAVVMRFQGRMIFVMLIHRRQGWHKKHGHKHGTWTSTFNLWET